MRLALLAVPALMVLAAAPLAGAAEARIPAPALEQAAKLRDRALVRLREGETGERLKDLVA